ncbi:hypothetical protein L0657_27530 [Dyadobacter sp. CY345]|uniref:hypothetical protein n=1 Tax=Dyadobacter sp. CY345 TaxID=2909335 RepID=UPI001F3E9FA4|nr:hypothetical protein [Dyadobacter sp. CY345]MCF2447737.1 hypothetical protein [Dyadobacter sp. CY345]
MSKLHVFERSFDGMPGSTFIHGKLMTSQLMTSLISQSLGRLFTVPEHDWTAINKRVGEAAAGAEVAQYLSEYIPEFPVLITVSKLWQDQTFESLIDLSAAVSLYAGNAVYGFQELLMAISQLDKSSDKVPDSVRHLTCLQFDNLTQSTSALSKIVSSVGVNILDFLYVNQEVDIRIARYTSRLGIYWEPLGETILKVDSAVTKSTADWFSLADTMQRILDVKPEITMCFLQNLDINTAITCWKKLQIEADSFNTFSENQVHYWY